MAIALCNRPENTGPSVLHILKALSFTMTACFKKLISLETLHTLPKDSHGIMPPLSTIHVPPGVTSAASLPLLLSTAILALVCAIG